jgi:hypothetical protein
MNGALLAARRLLTRSATADPLPQLLLRRVPALFAGLALDWRGIA